ncbi:MAG: uroporphyrinogen-III synthase [Candidatus Coatesbacteria bacterium]
MTRPPLAGVRVVTTREGPADPVLARHLRLVGARVIGCPAIRLERITRPRGAVAVVRRWPAFDWIVFTSAAAVRDWNRFRRARRLGPRGPRAAAVGRETARAIRNVLGLRVAAMPKRFSGDALAGALGPVRGLRILIPRALVAREALPRELRRRGATVTILPLYRTRPDAQGLLALRRLVLAGRADWVAFASPSAAASVFGALGVAGRRAFRARVRAASIGPTTSAALRRRGLPPAAEAATSTMAGLARAILRYHRRRHVTPAR